MTKFVSILHSNGGANWNPKNFSLWNVVVELQIFSIIPKLNSAQFLHSSLQFSDYHLYWHCTIIRPFIIKRARLQIRATTHDVLMTLCTTCCASVSHYFVKFARIITKSWSIAKKSRKKPTISAVFLCALCKNCLFTKP